MSTEEREITLGLILVVVSWFAVVGLWRYLVVAL